jgi:hypothetical protein
MVSNRTILRGRSDNAIKNRWYSHIQYDARRDGNAFVLDQPGDNGDNRNNPVRRKRNRLRICPKQNAIRWLEQQQAWGHRAMACAVKPSAEADNKPPQKSVFEELWDRNPVEDQSEEGFGFTVFPIEDNGSKLSLQKANCGNGREDVRGGRSGLEASRGPWGCVACDWSAQGKQEQAAPCGQARTGAADSDQGVLNRQTISQN